MTKNQISEKYEKQWVKRTLRAGGELFDQYERNWVLPKLFRRKEKVLDLASGNSIVGSYLQDNYNARLQRWTSPKLRLQMPKSVESKESLVL